MSCLGPPFDYFLFESIEKRKPNRDASPDSHRKYARKLEIPYIHTYIPTHVPLHTYHKANLRLIGDLGVGGGDFAFECILVDFRSLIRCRILFILFARSIAAHPERSLPRSFARSLASSLSRSSARSFVRATSQPPKPKFA